MKPEILAPAGDFTCLQAAVDAGADAVYFGLGTFNMRARSGVNFKIEDLPEIARRCETRSLGPAGSAGAQRRRGPVRRYLTLNAIMFEEEMEEVEKTIIAAKPYVDAFIVSDWGVISLCKKHGARYHVSTQMSTSNSAAASYLQFYYCAGAITGADGRYQTMHGVVADGEYHTLTVNLADLDYWTGDIHSIRLDYFDQAAVGDTMYIKSIRLIEK